MAGTDKQSPNVPTEDAEATAAKVPEKGTDAVTKPARAKVAKKTTATKKTAKKKVARKKAAVRIKVAKKVVKKKATKPIGATAEGISEQQFEIPQAIEASLTRLKGQIDKVEEPLQAKSPPLQAAAAPAAVATERPQPTAPQSRTKAASGSSAQRLKSGKGNIGAKASATIFPRLALFAVSLFLIWSFTRTQPPVSGVEPENALGPLTTTETISEQKTAAEIVEDKALEAPELKASVLPAVNFTDRHINTAAGKVPENLQPATPISGGTQSPTSEDTPTAKTQPKYTDKQTITTTRTTVDAIQVPENLTAESEVRTELQNPGTPASPTLNEQVIQPRVPVTVEQPQPSALTEATTVPQPTGDQLQQAPQRLRPTRQPMWPYHPYYRPYQPQQYYRHPYYR